MTKSLNRKIKNGLEKQRKEVFAAASKKKNEAESLIREYEEKVALQNGYLSSAEAKYREQVDLNERYEISKRLLSEERKKRNKIMRYLGSKETLTDSIRLLLQNHNLLKIRKKKRRS